MIKNFLVLAIAAVFTFGTVSCREEKDISDDMEEVADDMEDAADDLEDDMEDAADDMDDM